MNPRLKKILTAGTFLAFSLVVFVALSLAGRSRDAGQRLESLANSVSAATAVVPVPKPENCLRAATLNCGNYLKERRNVGKIGNLFWPKPKAERAELAKLIAVCNPDVIALQEIGGEAQLKLLRGDLKALGADYPFFCVLQGRDERRNLALLSKIQFTRIQKFAETETMCRGVLSGTVFWKETPVDIFNIHLKSRLTRTAADPQCARERFGEAERALEIVRQNRSRPSRKNKKSHCILLGDFNDIPDSPPLKLFKKSRTVKSVPAEDSNGETWTFENPEKQLRDTSDYMFVSPALVEKIRGNKISIACGDNECRGTDHRILWADFEF